MKVSEVMTTDVVSINYEANLLELARLLDQKRVSGVAVVDGNGALVGVISRTDLGSGLVTPPVASEFDKERSSSTSIDGQAMEGFLNGKVRDLMSEHVITASPEQELEELVKEMIAEKVHRVFVTSAEEVVGVVSAADMLPAFYEYLTS